jgi:hypothetical protein
VYTLYVYSCVGRVDEVVSARRCVMYLHIYDVHIRVLCRCVYICVCAYDIYIPGMCTRACMHATYIDIHMKIYRYRNTFTHAYVRTHTHTHTHTQTYCACAREHTGGGKGMVARGHRGPTTAHGPTNRRQQDTSSTIRARVKGPPRRGRRGTI